MLIAHELVLYFDRNDEKKNLIFFDLRSDPESGLDPFADPIPDGSTLLLLPLKRPGSNLAFA